jgi:aspartyl-tRNA(Asn)/glutamyl-tRNA(Gln) amidotransferase subunit C
MAIDKNTVRYVANLARIGLSEKEIEHFTGQLSRILDYVHKLKNLDIEKLEPTSHVLEMKNVYREDRLKMSLHVPEVMKNSPSQENNLFKVRKIIEA